MALVTCEQAAVEAWTNLGTERSRSKGNPIALRTRLTELLSHVEIHASDPDPSRHLFSPWELTDQDDVPILMGAINGNCQYLLTADYDCFGPYYGKSTHGVTVLPPGRFLQIMGVAKQSH